MLRGNVPALVDLMHLERVDTDLFTGRSPEGRSHRIYGGQVAAQSVIAAQRTVDVDWRLHSLHAYFLRPGDPLHALLYVVERIRDGRSFATRRIVVRQKGRAVFSMDASFQRPEPGLAHAEPFPDVPPPEALPTPRDVHLAARRDDAGGGHDWGWPPRPFDVRFVDPPSPAGAAGPRPPRLRCWFRLARPLAPSELAAFDDLAPEALHQALLVYASDHTILDTALQPHAHVRRERPLQIASLDHAMWFHAPVDCADWVLYDQDAPSAAAGRGFGRGLLFTRDGRLVASAMQESLMRPVPEGTP